MKADEVLNLLTGQALKTWEARCRELMEAGLAEDQAATLAYREQADVSESDLARTGSKPKRATGIR